MAAAPNGPNSASSNPRKFSEKIALQRQRQAEETAAFEEVMMDITSTRMQAQKLRLAHTRGPYYGGSLPNVNQIGSSSSEFQGAVHSPLDSRSTRHHGLVERVQRDPRRMMSSLRRYMRQIDSSPYSSAFLSPPPESSWRRNMPWGNFPMEKGQLFRLPSALNRTNSDSALHTSMMNPGSQDLYSGSAQGDPSPGQKAGLQDDAMDSKVFPFQVPSLEESFLQDSKHLLKPWDSKKLPAGSARPRSCEVPGINIYPSLDQPSSVSLMPSLLNSGGSLPDLTNLHFPPPLPTPLDPDESSYSSLSGGSSTSNLTSTMTNLGIDGSLGLSIGYNHGFTSPLQSSLSNPSLQSSLSHPNLQSSLSSQSLQSSLSNPSLQSSLSSTSMPSSMSNPSIQSSTSNPSLSSSLSNPSLGSPSIQTSPTNPTLPTTFSSTSYSPMVNSPISTSPRRRVPLSPLILPLGGDTRRQHSKQFSPTVPPTLSSITQGVPLDTSQLPVDQRLPPYPFNQSNPLLPSQQPLVTQKGLHQSQQPLQRTSFQQLTQPHQQNQGLQHHYSELQQHQQVRQHQQEQQQHQHCHQEPRHQLHHEQHLPHQEEQHAHPQEQQHRHHQEEQQPHHQQEHSQRNHHQHRHLKQEQQHLHCQEQPNTRHYQEQPNADRQQDQQQETRQQDPKQEHSDEHQPCQTHAQSQQPLRANHHYAFPQYLHGASLQQYNHAMGDYSLGTFEQFNMVESTSDGLQLNNNAFLGSSGDYDYHPGVNLGMNEDNSNFHDPLSLNKQNLSNCTRHGNIPNIILTGDSPPGFSKEITSALAGVPGFEVDTSLDLDEELRIEPLTLDGLHMLSDPYALLTDPSVEDSFRTDRLQ